jgi:hypothetical protein
LALADVTSSVGVCHEFPLQLVMQSTPIAIIASHHYWITSSAVANSVSGVANSVSGMVRPSALAVFAKEVAHELWRDRRIGLLVGDSVPLSSIVVPSHNPYNEFTAISVAPE